MSQYHLDRMFQPRRVVVVGASESTGSIGNALMKNLMDHLENDSSAKSILLHIGAMHIPFMQTVLPIEPITVWEWAEVLMLTVPLLIVMEIFKRIRARHHPGA
jgi:hypothetical protein